MKKTLNSAFYTGAILMGLVVFSASFIIWAALEYGTRTFEAAEPEVIHDTVVVEVIKEVRVEVPVEVPVAAPKPATPKPVEVPKAIIQEKVEEPKQDTVSTDI